MEYLKSIWKGSSKKETEKAHTALPETVKSVESEEAKLNKTDDFQVTTETKTEPVLEIKYVEKFKQYLLENTYLQPEDCLSCKLLSTGCATLSLGMLLLLDIKQSAKHKIPKHRVTISKIAISSVWILLIHREWYNCLFTKPELGKARTIEQYERERMKKIWSYFVD